MVEERHGRESLFLIYATSMDRASFAASLRSNPDFYARFGDRELELLGRLESLSTVQLIEQLSLLQDSKNYEAAVIVLGSYLPRVWHSLRRDDLEELEKAIATSDKQYQLRQAAQLAWLEASLLDREGHPEEAIEVLEGTLGSMSRQRNTAIGDYIRRRCYSKLGDLHSRVGNFHVANDSLSNALKLSLRWQFGRPQLNDKQQLAELLWMSGQAEQALFLHRDEGARRKADSAGLETWLLRSYLSACKCAIDCKEPEIAASELALAHGALDRVTGNEHLRGYSLLYSGQIALQRGDIEEAINLMNRAQYHFEQMDPPYHRGILEAKIAQAEFALYEEDYVLFFKLLEVLLSEAESVGCVEARSRLLLLEAYLFITNDPPLKDAFERTVERIHLINNPALLLQALSFLFNYALKYLPHREQAFLLNRIRGLEELLEKSCFEGLYKHYVSDRYEAAIEDRLARLLEEEEGQLENDG